MSPSARADITVPSLDGALVSPLGAPGEITVLMFVTTDCPIANRYAPEIRRIYEEFDDRVTFWLVYVSDSDNGQVGELTDHHDSFGFPMQGVRDLNNALVDVTGVTVTPEVAVYDTNQKLRYRGRINDRYVEFGVTRSAASTRAPSATKRLAIAAPIPVVLPVTMTHLSLSFILTLVLNFMAWRAIDRHRVPARTTPDLRAARRTKRLWKDSRFFIHKRRDLQPLKVPAETHTLKIRGTRRTQETLNSLSGPAFPLRLGFQSELEDLNNSVGVVHTAPPGPSTTTL